MSGADSLGKAVTTEEGGGPGLRDGVLSFPEVLAQSVANMAPSAAMALLPLLVFLNAGTARGCRLWSRWC